MNVTGYRMASMSRRYSIVETVDVTNALERAARKSRVGEGGADSMTGAGVGTGVRFSSGNLVGTPGFEPGTP
jgi:hypothetical protein